MFFVVILRFRFEYGCNVWLNSHERYGVEVGRRSMGKVIVLVFNVGSRRENTCSQYCRDILLLHSPHCEVVCVESRDVRRR